MLRGYQHPHSNKEKSMARRKHHKKFGSKTAARAKFKATAKKCSPVRGKAAKKACWRAAYRK